MVSRGHPIRVRAIGGVCVAACLGWLAGGCAWWLPSGPPSDLQRTLDEASKIKDSRTKNAMLTAALHARVAEFQDLIERNLALRERILREANRLEESFKRKPDLDSADLKLVSEGAARFLQLRDELFALVNRYECLMQYSEAELLRNGVDPRLRLVAVMVSVGAALTLYDNYLTTVVRFEQSVGLRRYVNHGDKSVGLDRRKLDEIGQSARSIVNRGQLRGAIKTYEEWKKKYPVWKARFQSTDGETDMLDQDFAYLETLIESSIWYEFVVGVHPAKLSVLKLETLSRTVPDLLHDSGDQLLRVLTRIFVEAVALIDLRQGLLYVPAEKRARILEYLNSTLKPGDILLEKAPFRLNDRVVPGYWGHAAMWLGTDEELSALGVWDDLRLAGLQWSKGVNARQSIRAGKSVIEATRSGVTLNSLEHFLNVDDLAVLRPRMNEDPARRPDQREAILTALMQLGKGYDFSFDVYTRDTMFCSELIFESYTQPEFHWPKKGVLGRYTISPDQLALRLMRTTETQPPLVLVAFCHQGQLMHGSQRELEATIFRLIKVKNQPGTQGSPAAGSQIFPGQE